jgi:hypothetical protein
MADIILPIAVVLVILTAIIIVWYMTSGDTDTGIDTDTDTGIDTDTDTGIDTTVHTPLDCSAKISAMSQIFTDQGLSVKEVVKIFKSGEEECSYLAVLDDEDGIHLVGEVFPFEWNDVESEWGPVVPTTLNVSQVKGQYSDTSNYNVAIVDAYATGTTDDNGNTGGFIRFYEVVEGGVITAETPAIDLDEQFPHPSRIGVNHQYELFNQPTTFAITLQPDSKLVIQHDEIRPAGTDVNTKINVVDFISVPSDNVDRLDVVSIKDRGMQVLADMTVSPDNEGRHGAIVNGTYAWPGFYSINPFS